MSRLWIVTIVCLLIPSSFAAPDILPITGSNGLLRYDVASGNITPVNEQYRDLGECVWAATESTGYFFGQTPDNVCLDWGDIVDNTLLGGLGVSEYTNSQAVDGDNTLIVMLYANDNGWNTQPKQYLVGFQILNIPGSTHPLDEYWGYIWRLEISRPYVLITGDDLDGDDLVDFSYAFYASNIRTPGAELGPGINGASDPNILPPSCPGIENAYDWYGIPDFINDTNMADTPYLGTYWFGGNPFAQFYFEMFAPGCPNAGASGRYCAADIYGNDCLVNLADLAECLGTYGIYGEFWPCDIYPPDPYFPGDGQVDLQDLAELLSQYGDNCN